MNRKQGNNIKIDDILNWSSTHTNFTMKAFYSIIKDIVVLALVFKIGNWYWEISNPLNNPKSILFITI